MTYADVVRIARELDDATSTDSDSGCIFSQENASLRFAADVNVAVRPLPDPPADLDTSFELGAPRLRVLTPWGPIGDPAPSLVLATFTHFRSTLTPSVALLMSDRGLRPVAIGLPGFRDGARPRALDGVAAEIREAVHGTGMPVFVVAEAEMSAQALVQALQSLESGGVSPIVLASVLPSGTRLPTAPAAEDTSALCANGEPPSVPEGAAEGDLDTQPLRDPDGQFQRGIRACAERAPPAVDDAPLEVAFRVDPEGAVDQACVLHDPWGSPTVRACLVQALRSLRLHTPTPAGYAVVAAPIRVALEAQAQRVICP